MLFALELALIGVFVAAMAIPQMAIFFALNLICGIVVAAGDIPMTTYLQVSVQDAFRGRVNAVKEMITTGIMPISMVMAGLLLRNLGLQGAFLTMGAVMTLAGAAGFLDRRYREVEMPAEAFTRPTPGLKEAVA